MNLSIKFSTQSRMEQVELTFTISLNMNHIPLHFSINTSTLLKLSLFTDLTPQLNTIAKVATLVRHFTKIS
jgi:hypothetical protein